MEKIKRDTFLYYPNPKNIKNFAQCSSCSIMTKDRKCAIIDEEVNLNDSCCAYVPGENGYMEVERVLTKKDIGFRAKTQVRCENCFFGGEHCRFYMLLNTELPKYFNLETKISPLACCNAWTPK